MIYAKFYCDLLQNCVDTTFDCISLCIHALQGEMMKIFSFSVQTVKSSNPNFPLKLELPSNHMTIQI